MGHSPLILSSAGRMGGGTEEKNLQECKCALYVKKKNPQDAEEN